MNSMSKCSACDGLVPARQVMCPHCDAPVPAKRRRSKFIAALSFASAGAVSMTLMACYGMPPCDYKAADDTSKHDGVLCKGVCVDPTSAMARHCYDVADAGTADAGAGDGG